MEFYCDWLINTYGYEDSAKGDFAMDVYEDPDFPIINSYQVMRDYLREANACKEVMKLLIATYLEYLQTRKKK